MPPANIRFGGGPTSTVLHPLVFVAMVLAILLIFILPRKYIIVPFLIIAMLTPWGQMVVVGGVHLTVVRIVLLFAWVRLLGLRLVSRLRPADGVTSLDVTFSLWAFFYAFAFVLLWWELPALVNRLGFLLDAFGIYFLFRYLIQDDEDVLRVIKTFTFIAVVIAIAMVEEHFTHRSIFGLLGGVPLYDEVRDGLVRSHAVFQHPILAGVFGATILPLFIGLWTQTKAKAPCIIGIVSATIIVMASASSTPLLTYMAVIGTLCVWPLRKHMNLIRWGIVCAMIALQLVMKTDIWWAISHVHVAGGSSYHRAALVDNFIRHFGDWWFLGAKHYYKWGWDMWDTSNEFCTMGVNGGLGAFIAFLAMITFGFKKLGKARKLVQGDRKTEWFVWCMGTALFAHIVAFFGISYWDQTQVAWFALIAMISTTAFVVTQPRVLHEPTPSEVGVELAAPTAAFSWTTSTSTQNRRYGRGL